MDDGTTFRIVFILLWVALMFVNGYFILKSRRSEERVTSRDQWRKITRYEGLPLVLLRGVLAPVWLAAIALYVLYPPWMAGLALPLPAWLRWGGVVLSLAALAWNSWAQIALGREYSRILRLREDRRLVTAGPYRWIRHPMYLGGSLFFLGVLLEACDALVAVAMVFSAALLIARVPKEEAMMLEGFGQEYREYQGRTGRLLPRLRRSAGRGSSG